MFESEDAVFLQRASPELTPLVYGEGEECLLGADHQALIFGSSRSSTLASTSWSDKWRSNAWVRAMERVVERAASRLALDRPCLWPGSRIG